MRKFIIPLLLLVLLAGLARATETENLGLAILPAPGKVVADGQFTDWDLSGGVFVCSDVENQREKYSIWFHAMYDNERLYILTRWNDETPMNNPGSSKGDYGFAGDCLQFRTVIQDGTPNERGAHWTCWRDRDGVDVVDVAYGKRFDGGSLRDAQAQGAVQEFRVNADGKGYVQELAIPWALLAKGGYVPKAGENMTITVEPNFSIGTSGRLTLKDIFKAGITPDRVFTFMSSPSWGIGTLEKTGKITPRPLRLADAREFNVKLANGLPVIDWTGLILVKELKGFKDITFTMPEDGYISLHIKDKSGTVVRQLLNNEFRPKGKHTVKWDGLTTTNWRTPGEPVPAGDYTWAAIWHKDIGLRLKGWADNAGNAPWDATPTANWGGDHGFPTCVAADGNQVYLGWSGAEAGKALLACDLQGNVLWKNSRGGMAGASLVAVDGKNVYAQHWGGTLYRVESAKGGYTAWAGSDNSPDVMIKSLWGEAKGMPEEASGLAAKAGKLYLTFAAANLVLVLDGASGKELKRFTVPAPGDIEVVSAETVYFISAGTAVQVLNTATGESKPLITGLKNARGLAVDTAGALYVGVREPANQVLVYDGAGKLQRTIGRQGGRSLLGKWTPDGMAFVSGIAVDAQGKLWVAEDDNFPKRISVWDTKTGALVKEMFGPTSYGALGGAISPLDPNIMVGQGCEWRIDPKTGRATNLGVITREGMEVSRFGVAPNGRLYLAVAPGWIHGSPFINIFERVGDADYKLRARFIYEGKDKTAKTTYWADANGDGERQPAEETVIDGNLLFSGWYMGLTPDMTIYHGQNQYKLTGFTACGAPLYDLNNPLKIAGAGAQSSNGLGSADGKSFIYNGAYGVDCSWFTAVDIATGKLLWRYPNNFVGVHGSHQAIPPEVGMIRGAYEICGAAKLPEPIGNVWAIATNVGEWHLLTANGFYLTRLFQPDPMKVQWPEQAVPGAIMDNAPCGMGGEDFGGSITTVDGKLYLQAGKTGFWNIEVVGLDTVQTIKGSSITIKETELAQAQALRESYLQAAVGIHRLAVKTLTPAFTGDLNKDFAGAEITNYQKQAEAAVRTAAAWDTQFLYLAWDVKDRTPWVNGADAPEYLYARGDTVDFQLGTDAAADKNRNEARPGDLRLSIGNFQGKPVAVCFRRVATEKHPMTFSSGIVREYRMESVTVLPEVKINLVKRAEGYLVEAAIPLASLGLTPKEGLTLRADFGVTHGTPGGDDTALRTYWNNQATGIVNDEVFELQMEPKNWGEITFK